VATVLAVALTLWSASTPHAQRGPQLNVCHAGSLTAAFTPLEEAFRRQYPEVTIVDTAGGSVDLARRFASGMLSCDVYAPADHLLIDLLMRPARLADYTIVFASGRMVLAYLATDPKAQSLRVARPVAPASPALSPASPILEVAGAWYETLTAPGVRIAGAHPFLDPGGYRSHMMFELMERQYHVPGLYNLLLQRYQVNVTDPANAAAGPTLGKDFNFQFTYEHSAAATARRDPNYRYVLLPPEIDLSRGNEPKYAGSVTIPGLGLPSSAPAVTIPAAQVAWGLTILKGSPHADQAARFLALVLGPDGAAALKANGPTPLTPARVSRSDLSHLPASLRSLVSAN
jgi:ABC-type molybdate transport system substrate-binding protein